MRKDDKSQKATIRMYCTGIGDFFLLRFGDYKVVVDCGIGSRVADREERLCAAIGDLAAATDGHINLLVITHEHQDHVSGFVNSKPAAMWRDIRIDNLWLAWTEDPEDTYANQLRATRRKAAKIVASAAAAFTTNLAASEQMSALVSQVYAGPESESWIDKIKKLVSDPANISYLQPAQTVDLDPKAGGVQAIVLGPPKSDMIERDKPDAKNPETYEAASLAPQFSLGANPAALDQIGAFLGVSTKVDSDPSDYIGNLRRHLGLEGLDEESQVPFGPMFRIPYEQAFRPSSAPSRLDSLTSGQLSILSDYVEPKNNWRRIDDEGLAITQTLALRLESDTNNTSLCLLFRLPDGRSFLFPGDAQIGNWLSWWDYTYKVKDKGVEKDRKLEQLYKEVIFYKVGHHGSHNGTLKDKGLENMSGLEAAMVPVVHDDAVLQGWKNGFPLPSLMERLRQITPNILTMEDRPEEVPQAFVRSETECKPGRPLYYEWSVTYK